MNISRRSDERIVRCTDNRSIPERNDDEGFTDIRTIILSIDQKTLEPVGVITIETFVAG